MSGFPGYLTARLEALECLKPPIFRPVEYSDQDVSRSSSKIVSDKADHDIPRTLHPAPLRELLSDLSECISLHLQSSSWPDVLFKDGQSLKMMEEFSLQEALNIAPSGEAGLSHMLKTALFDKVNKILFEIYPERLRYWRVIGIGGSGRTDWGCFVDNVLRVIVELKPNKRFNATDMEKLITIVSQRQPFLFSSYSASSPVTAVSNQMWHEFGNKAAKQVQYGLVLCESSGDRPSSALLFKRMSDRFLLGMRAIQERQIPFPQYPDFLDLLENSPTVLILALSLLPEQSYDPPDYNRPPPEPKPQRPSATTRSLHAQRFSDRADSDAGPSRPTADLITRPQTRMHTHQQGPSAVSTRSTRSAPAPRPGQTSSTQQDHSNETLDSHMILAPTLDSSSGTDSGHSNGDSDIGNDQNLWSSPDTSLSMEPVEIDLDTISTGFSLSITLEDGETDNIVFKGPLPWTVQRSLRQLPPVTGHVDEHLEQHPFPSISAGPKARGALWTVYEIEPTAEIPPFHPGSPSHYPLVVKICIPSSFLAASYGDVISDSYSPSEAQEAIKREFDFYSDELSELQGELVPHFAGIFVGRTSQGDMAWAAIMENAGERVNRDQLNHFQIIKIGAMYRRLHHLGILHQDARPQNWLVNSDRTIRIIDFERSMTKAELRLGDEEWEDKTNEEMLAVCGHLGIPQRVIA